MFTIVLAAVLSLTAPSLGTGVAEGTAPGDGLVLDRPPSPVAGDRAADRGGGTPIRGISGGLLGGTGASSIVIGAAAIARSRARRDEEPLFVLVHGHGGRASDFDRLLELMGVSPDRVVAFDYRTAGSGRSSQEASRYAMTPAAALELEFLIRELAEEHANIYSLHHSKGGAVGVDMIANLDEGRRDPIDGYRGAALLDPAISGGALGWVQRFGEVIGPLPDNGGFDPIRCDADGCRDVRANLGEASGVEVIAIRNPDALVTNFTDEPEGLRTYDLVHDGKPSPWAYLPDPRAFFFRMFEAHGSVLSHTAVSDCITAEVARPGSCQWSGSYTPRIGWRGGGSNRARAM